MAQKYYAIKKDNGIITATWDECEKITKGQHYSFKSFTNLNEAITFLGSNPDNFEWIGLSNPSQQKILQDTNCSNMAHTAFTIYTDGGCIPNPGGKGGIGVVILHSGKVIKEISESYAPTTNNRMEVTAAIRALQSIGSENTVQIVSDSQYLVKTMNGEFSMNKNNDLWIQLRQEIQKQQNVYFGWTKGHANQTYNERCDSLASNAIESLNPINDDGYMGQVVPYQKSQTVAINTPAFIDVRRDVPDNIINPECAKAVKQFRMSSKHSFKDFMNLKTYGRDTVSSFKMNELIVWIQNDELVSYIQSHKTTAKHIHIHISFHKTL